MGDKDHNNRGVLIRYRWPDSCFLIHYKYNITGFWLLWLAERTEHVELTPVLCRSYWFWLWFNWLCINLYWPFDLANKLKRKQVVKGRQVNFWYKKSINIGCVGKINFEQKKNKQKQKRTKNIQTSQTARYLRWFW